MTSSRQAKRVVIHNPGSYEVLKLEDYEYSEPGPEEVSIKVAAAGVNYADCVIRMGLYKSAKELHGYPITPGFEIAGQITAVGKAVKTYQVGDLVLGISLFGGYCSHITLPSDYVFKLPTGVDVIDAAGIATVYLTAWFALHQLAHIQAGERVLVHSGAGGVGLAALQLIKRAGATAVAVIGAPHKSKVAEAYGADSVIDKSCEPLWQAAAEISPQGYHCILDPNGYSTLADSYSHLAPVGKLVIYGFHSMLPKAKAGSKGLPNYLKLARDWLRTPRFNPLDMTADNKSVLAFNLSFLSSRLDLMQTAMADILIGLKDGSLRALPVEAWPLAEAGKAQQRLETGQTTGKLVLIP